MIAERKIAALDWPRKFATYSASELETISGLSREMQRLWRQRGYIPAVESRYASFSPTEVVEVSIRHALSRRGIPPSVSPAIDPDAVKGAIYHAIINHEGSCEIIGPPEEVDEFLHEFELKDFAFELAQAPNRTNYLVWDDDEGPHLVDDLNELFDEKADAIAAINLRVIGARIMERGRKPIVTLEAPPTPGVKPVRRLSGIGANDS